VFIQVIKEIIMAHMIDTLSKGRASYASTQREWHGLGQLMPAGQTIEQWQAAAGMDYEVKRGRVRYATEVVSPNTNVSDLHVMDDKIVLFRSDTGAALGVVSDKYKVVQPAAVLAFFREWADKGGVTIESAGVLFGGARYFATAKLADGVSLDGGRDRIVPYALLSTSADGSLATECRWTTVRTVCNNTLTMARKGAANFKVSHRSVFKPEDARDAVEAANEEFSAFMTMARDLAKIKMERDIAENFTVRLLAKSSDEVARESKAFDRIMSLFKGEGKGADFETAHDTAWGWLNAVTEYADHHVRAHNDENRKAAALWGAGDALKQKALSLVTA
jgi:phage/plasmid-like protein (TIGR03299 family)